jgi:putative acetyltransferase
VVWEQAGTQEKAHHHDSTVRPRDRIDLLTAWENTSEIAHPFLAEEFLASEREAIPNLYLPDAETCVFNAAGQVVGFIAPIGNEVGAIFVHRVLDELDD